MTAITVWMSVRRAGNQHHSIVVTAAGSLHTACGRFVSSTDGVRHGGLLRDDEAREMGTPCERCWPGGR